MHPRARRRYTRRPHRPVRTHPVGADRGRRRDHRRRDLPVPRRRQLRQQDDVVADRRRAHRDAGRHGGGVLRAARPAPCCPRPARRSSSTACRAPTCTAGHRAAARRAATRYNMESGPPVFAPLLASLVGGMGLLAARAAPGGPAAARRRDQLMPFRPPDRSAPSPRRTAAGSPASTCWTRPTVGRRHRRCGAGPAGAAERCWRSSPRTRGDRRAAAGPAARPGQRAPRCRCWPLIDTRLADRRDRRLALRRPARGRPGVARHACAYLDRRRPRPARRRASPQLAADASRRALIQAVQDLATGTPAWHGLARRPRVEPVDPVRLHRVLLPPLGVERDRLPRPGLPARLHQPRRRRPRTVGVADHARRRPGAVRAAGSNAPAAHDDDLRRRRAPMSD